ncbi:MAG: co-chaperone GroES [Cytophagales bacterium]|nr:co-chaperone GroES [Cytophagales bacterium]
MSTINFKPLADRVLVEPVPAEEMTSSGIIIPDTAKENPQQGQVVAVGPGTKDNKMTLCKEDVVLYGKYAGTEIQLQGKAYLIMKVTDVYGVISAEEVLEESLV